jgi:hypothetical protein
VVSNQDSTKLTTLKGFIMSYIDYFGVPKADNMYVQRDKLWTQRDCLGTKLLVAHCKVSYSRPEL